jgi:PKD repeat protein
VDGNPGATILTTGPFCSADSPISLSAAVAGGTWYGPGVTNFGTFNPQSLGAGTYTIGYYITTGLCTASDTATFVVFQTPDANITGPVNLCTDATPVTLTAPTSGGVWSGPGTNPSTGVFNPLTAGAGVHTISYNVTIGICSASDTHVITVNQTPDASITTVGPFCANSAGLQLNSPNPGGVWSGPGTSSSGFFTPSLAGAGTHTITHSVTTNGCTGTATQTIIVNPTPNSAITPAGPFCAYDAPFQLNAATSGGTWSGTGVNASGLFTPSQSGAGNFIITYSVGSGPCSSTSNILITVQDAPNASILPAGPFCANQSAVALNVITPGGTFSGPGMNGNLFNPQTANIGSNQITYTVTVGNCSSSSSTTIQVNPLPTAGFDTLTTGNGQITFSNTSTGATSYSWDFGDGTFSDDTNPIHNYDQTGFYSVTVTAINACGSVTFTMTVNVKVDATSVESLDQNLSFNVFPNPAIETITIVIQSKSNEKSMSLRLIDINGKVVRLEKLQLTNGQLNMILPIDDLEFGVYTLQLESGENVLSKKIVKM